MLLMSDSVWKRAHCKCGSQSVWVCTLIDICKYWVNRGAGLMPNFVDLLKCADCNACMAQVRQA